LDTFFSGLNLEPGTYYLVLSSDGGNQYWFSAFDGGIVTTTGAGVTYNGDYFVSGYSNTNETNPPASSFYLYGDYGLNLQVESLSVPESGANWMCGLAAMVVGAGILFKRRLKQSRPNAVTPRTVFQACGWKTPE
jgi:hypothetical protein